MFLVWKLKIWSMMLHLFPMLVIMLCSCQLSNICTSKCEHYYLLPLCPCLQEDVMCSCQYTTVHLARRLLPIASSSDPLRQLFGCGYRFGTPVRPNIIYDVKVFRLWNTIIATSPDFPASRLKPVLERVGRNHGRLNSNNLFQYVCFYRMW